jgi:hypothetical protein
VVGGGGKQKREKERRKVRESKKVREPFSHRQNIGSPVGGPHSLGEIRGAAAVEKASAAARNF